MKDADFIDVTGFDLQLDHPTRNKSHTATFLERGSNYFVLDDYTPPWAYQFRRAKCKMEFRLISNDTTVYYFKLKNVEHILPAGEIATVATIWRSDLPKHERALTGLSAALFAELVKRFTFVIGENELRPNTARFWRTRIREAIESPYQYVYIWDTHIPMIPVTGQEQFSNQWEEFIWGQEHEVARHRMFVISGRDLFA
ncbi:hypothetical protein D7B12_18165 [Salmonella enterica]|nr:hypothetical protein [Salmonella enterica]